MRMAMTLVAQPMKAPIIGRSHSAGSIVKATPLPREYHRHRDSHALTRFPLAYVLCWLRPCREACGDVEVFIEVRGARAARGAAHAGRFRSFQNSSRKKRRTVCAQIEFDGGCAAARAAGRLPERRGAGLARDRVRRGRPG